MQSSSETIHTIPAVENNVSLHGGVAILVKNTTPQQQLHINTALQAIALRATCRKSITICSIDLSPSTAYSITNSKTSVNFLLLFCFWGISISTVSNGALPNAIPEEGWWRNFSSRFLIVLHPATASLSASSHPALYLDFCWQTDSYLHGSDHYPIVIASFYKPTWKLYKANGQHSRIKHLWNSALTVSAVQRILFKNLRMFSST